MTDTHTIMGGNPKRAATILALIVIGLWITSLWMPALGTCYQNKFKWYYGSDILSMGPFGLIAGEAGWYANVFLLFSIIGLARGRLRFSLNDLMGLLLALTSFQKLEIWPNEAWSEPVCARGIGFWLWIGCYIIISSTGIAAYFLMKKEEQPPKLTN
jgi:hypothetical protein